MNKYTNRLIKESSPYLRQHAHNPVDWYPWGEEAISRAKKKNKPIFLSIGYSACHWCHVMEKECFNNEEIARIMNERFINVKVDREERPDLDEIYMSAVQLISGTGGWPLNVFLTPNLVPFFGGTYFPPTDRRGMASFPKILMAVSEYYRTHQEEAEKGGLRIKENIQAMVDLTPSVLEEIDPQIVNKAQEILVTQFDSLNGGFGQAPKFPNPPILLFLLRMRKINEALPMVELTLDKMARGGIHDHLGGGFHRYAVDDQWIIPHFEKMLYDNALLARIYLEAYQATQKNIYLEVAENIFAYILREMHDPQGGFYTSQDADSEGQEGKFFLWTKDEVLSLLGKDRGRIFSDFYGITDKGNFEDGNNVLYIAHPKEKISGLYGISITELEEVLAEGRKILLAEREKRIKPATDKKIITAWNGLMISAFILGYEITGKSHYLHVAAEAASFIMKRMKIGSLLFRAWAEGQRHINGFADDYAFFIQALLDLYEATFEEKYLKEAEDLNREMLNRFWDDQKGGYFYTGKDVDSLIIRPKNIYDNVLPSANSIAVGNLIRLSILTADDLLKKRAEKILRLYYPSIWGNPLALSCMLSNIDFYFNLIEIRLIGPKDDSMIERMLKKIYKKYLPYRIIKFQASQEFAKGSALPIPAVIVCQNFTCMAALYKESELEEVLDKL